MMFFNDFITNSEAQQVGFESEILLDPEKGKFTKGRFIHETLFECKGKGKIKCKKGGLD